MLIIISYTIPEPISRQIIDQLKISIMIGYLEIGEKLPSIREMVGELKISDFMGYMVAKNCCQRVYITRLPATDTL